MELEEFLLLEKQRLQREREKLKAKSYRAASPFPQEPVCPAELLIQQNSAEVLSRNCKRNSGEAQLLLPSAAKERQEHALDYYSYDDASADYAFIDLASTRGSNAAGEEAKRNKNSQQDTERSSFHSDYTAKSSVQAVAAANDGDVNLLKETKDWLNKQKDVENNMNINNNTSPREKKNLSEKDDMEQWVTDTFYSYFPGYNNESQRRQHDLQKRQQENQENLIKHQMLHAAANQKFKRKSQQHSNPAAITNLNSNRSTSSSTTSNATSGLHGIATRTNPAASANKKTDLEIINVNNPNYVPATSATKYNLNNSDSAAAAAAVRPGSTRYKLLQDLQHTNLTNILSSGSNANGGIDGELEMNRKHAELESARKKEYQRELMQQIEDKRNTIKLLRDKEKQQEEILTRRLQEQLRTMKLEEQLEKERLKAVKVRFDAEQNNLMRERLLAKLENDSKLLNQSQMDAEQRNQANLMLTGQRKRLTATNDSNKENIANSNRATVTEGDNKVYKYFSNSAKNEYSYRNKSSSLVDAAEVASDNSWDLEVSVPELTKIENECFHLTEKICPMCDGPLKEYENFCLHCQNRLSLRLRRSQQPVNGNNSKQFLSHKEKQNSSVKETDSTERSEAETAAGNPEQQETEEELEKHRRTHSFSLVCNNCDRFYTMCPKCVSQRNVCRACNKKLNVCMNCRRNLCTFCLEEIACGKDIEETHVNEQKMHKRKSKDFAEEPKQQQQQQQQPVFSINEHYLSTDFKDNQSSPAEQRNNLSNPPYSINIERNSIFHPINKPSTIFSSNTDELNNYQIPHVVEKPFSFAAMEQNSNLSSNRFPRDSFEDDDDDEDANIERLRRDTDRKLGRYFKNYADLAQQTRSTQTTPNTTARRDIVLNGEHSLALPLMREMPKMTRMETKFVAGNIAAAGNKYKSTDLENLQRRWEIPAVQKYSISPNSPKIVTQVGAIRKQLQVDSLFSDEGDDY